MLPAVVASAILQLRFFTGDRLFFAIVVLGISVLFGAVTIRLRAATPAGAFTGAAITASLMFSTAAVPYQPWRTALIPVLAVFLLAFAATRLGRAKKERLGLAERRGGRVASQVAANLGFAALACDSSAQSWLIDTHASFFSMPILAIGLAALAEAAGDTVSSEIGQALGGRPRSIVTLRRVEPGTDGGITLLGTWAGIFAAGIVAALGTVAMQGSWEMLGMAWGGGVFGLLFDSVLGATLERRGWLNNDAVNFLSTASASAVATLMLALLPHPPAAG